MLTFPIDMFYISEHYNAFKYDISKHIETYDKI